MFSNEPIQATAQGLHGLCSCAEWTGVPLSTLLTRPVSTEGEMVHRRSADSLALSRSVPVKKAMDDAMIASPERRAAHAIVA